MTWADFSVVYVCFISSGLEKGEYFLPHLGWGFKSSIPFFVSVLFRKIVGFLLSIKNLMHEAKYFFSILSCYFSPKSNVSSFFIFGLDIPCQVWFIPIMSGIYLVLDNNNEDKRPFLE